MSACRFGLIRCLLRLWLASFLASGFFAKTAHAQSVGFVTQRPFVVSVIPVVGGGPFRNNVGGVAVDAKGVVANVTADESGRMAALWRDGVRPKTPAISTRSRLRKVSLRRLEAELVETVKRGEKLPHDMLFLAGLQRIQYVLVYPDLSDIVLAGYAEGWRVDDRGHVVGKMNGEPVLRLDDLLVALRTAEAAASGKGISCSIDPTDEGMTRLDRAVRGTRSARPGSSDLNRFAKAMGPQQVSITGVQPTTHFAHVMLAADVAMKRLAMQLEPSPLAELPSYLQLIREGSRMPRNVTPRFWLAVDYEPLKRSKDGLAWQIQGQGVAVEAEDATAASAGAATKKPRRTHATYWAELMTKHYGAVAAHYPIFNELRGCIDMAVVGALLAKENLPGRSGCSLRALLDPKFLQPEEHGTPKTLASHATLLRKSNRWIVSVSGGVDVDSWKVTDQVVVEGSLTELLEKQRAEHGRWWWD